MTPLLWGLAWLTVSFLVALILGCMIRKADEAQERALAKRRHPSAVGPSGPICLDSDHPCPPNCSPGYPACSDLTSSVQWNKEVAPGLTAGDLHSHY